MQKLPKTFPSLQRFGNQYVTYTTPQNIVLLNTLGFKSDRDKYVAEMVSNGESRRSTYYLNPPKKYKNQTVIIGAVILRALKKKEIG